MFVDFHGHIYPCFSLTSCLRSAQNKFPGQPKIIFLTEKQDCCYFSNYAALSEKHNLPGITDSGANFISIEHNISFVRGRQFATANGTEVLALFCSPDIRDGRTTAEYCSAINDCGGIIAFSWAFGKWRGERSGQIESACCQYGPQKVLLLDSRLRPAQLPLPKAMIRLHTQDFSIFAGSDPLPLSDHQNTLLQFCTEFENRDHGNLNPDELIRRLLTEKSPAKFAGERSGIFSFLKDQLLLRI